MRRTIAMLGMCALLTACTDKDKSEEPAPGAKPTEGTVAPPAPPAPETRTPVTGTIVEVALGDPRFSTLVSALTKAEMVETLKGEGPYTVFAPTNDAFAKVPKETLDAVLANKEELTAVLRHHVVDKKIMSQDLAGAGTVAMLDGTSLTVDTKEGVRIGEARVEQADVEASNGVIHVIDTVLMPK